ncbi:MAG: ABC transporter ATP-binding protein [Xanthobacteraceae bacterium]|nr:ABC transporter ATP-binding protein [Xanthobacteraceae bacterium]
MNALLKAERFSAAYGPAPVVRAISLALDGAEVVALMGRNGMGKTTLLRGLMGLTPVRDGKVTLAQREISALSPEVIARAGIGYVPAGREIFASLSVRENLVMCAREAAGSSEGWDLARVLKLFPRLAERLDNGGRQLSGGEQQMLAIGRALMTNPRLLLIDEATEGLAPLVARSIWATLTDICRTGVAAIIVDRNLKQLAGIATRAVVLFRGEIAFDGDPASLLADTALVEKYIGL